MRTVYISVRATVYAAVLAIGLTILAPDVVFAQEAPVSTEKHPSVDLPTGLDRILRDYEREWKAGNATALAELFTENGFALPSGRPPFRGREAIAEAYGQAGGNLSLRALSFRTDGKVGFIIGAYSYDASAGDSGKFVLAIEKSPEGRWLIAADIDNSTRR
jgi:ketosteroid isomerase-like protein